MGNIDAMRDAARGAHVGGDRRKTRVGVIYLLDQPEFLQHELLQVGFGNALLLPEPGYNVFVKERFVCRETRLLHKPFLVRLPTQGDVAECDYIVLKTSC